MLSLSRKDLTLSCFLSSSLQPGSPSYLPSDWLLYLLGIGSQEGMWAHNSLSTAPPKRAELASKYKQYQAHPQHIYTYVYIHTYTRRGPGVDPCRAVLQSLWTHMHSSNGLGGPCFPSALHPLLHQTFLCFLFFFSQFLLISPRIWVKLSLAFVK